ncbi:MAG: DUF3467 domain-containing protein [Patescibacteria group bacterium]
MQNKQQPIRINDESITPIYATTITISHSPEQFAFSFMSDIPPVRQLLKNIVISPQHAKRLLYTLSQNLVKYETKYGPVRDFMEPIVTTSKESQLQDEELNQVSEIVNNNIVSVKAMINEGLLSDEEKTKLNELATKLKNELENRNSQGVERISSELTNRYNTYAKKLFDLKRKDESPPEDMTDNK